MNLDDCPALFTYLRVKFSIAKIKLNYENETVWCFFVLRDMKKNKRMRDPDFIAIWNMFNSEGLIYCFQMKWI